MADAVRQHLVPGCAAGIVADLITHPLSVAKTRLQVQGSGGGKHGARVYRGATHTLWSIATREGVPALYSGLGAVLVGAAPAQGLYFGGYEVAKSILGGGGDTAGNFASGVCAQLVGSIVWVPMDVIKERLQLGKQVKVVVGYSGSFVAFREILRQEGIRGLYRAYWIHQATWAPFNGCYFAVYEKCKRLCIDAGYEDGSDNLEPIAQVSCGAAAGIVASLITNPMDVVKTRLQVARANPEMFPYSAALPALRHLLEHEGAAALMDGAGARVIWLTPRLTICVAAFERMKTWVA